MNRALFGIPIAVLIGAAALPSRAAEPSATVIATKFSSCFEQEGVEFSEEDRAAVDSITEDMLGGGLECPGGGGTASCADNVEGMSCEDLAADLLNQVAPDGLPRQIAAWAEAYASALVDRTVVCHHEETGEDLGQEEEAKIDSFEEVLARSLTMLTESGGCRQRDEVVPVCTQWLNARTCEQMLKDMISVADIIRPSPEQAAAAPTPLPDVDTMEDEELDALLASEAGQRRTLTETMTGPCTELLNCEPDLDAQVEDAELDPADAYYEFHEKKAGDAKKRH